MKALFVGLLTVLSLAWIIAVLGIGVGNNYKYTRDVASYWNLADKSSTLDAKSEYIDKFINALSDSKNFSEYNAIWLKTQDNSFSKNIDAVKTLQSRLKKIKNLDENSFAYQTAIQQITAQEQGEAHKMLSEIKGCWYLHNCPIMWDWIGMCFTYILLIVFWIALSFYND